MLSLPNNLLAHVPITEISSTLTSKLSDESELEEEVESDDDSTPNLIDLFTIGQYLPARVVQTFPTASQSFSSQYSQTETIRLAARVELTLKPEKINADTSKQDVTKGYAITGEVLSEEDKGYQIGLGLQTESDSSRLEGWLSKKDVEKHAAGELLPLWHGADEKGENCIRGSW